MSFLQPALLIGLPLALIPVIIHLIHLHRRNTIPWAATMFLLRAQQMNRGYSRLRRLLILAFRVLALAALILTVARPLAGGLLGITGGAPDTVLVLVDRSASMQQADLATGASKLESGLNKLQQALEDAYRGRSRLVILDSATLSPDLLTSEHDLLSLNSTQPTSTSGDIPSLLQAGIDYLAKNQEGRTDVWILSDLQEGDWDHTSGRWNDLQQALVELPGVRLQLLAYPTPPASNLTLANGKAVLRSSDLVLDIDILENPASNPAAEALATQTIPLRLTINGATSTIDLELAEGRSSLRGHQISLANTKDQRGWGKVELPADSHAADNVWNFTFDQSPARKSVIISDSPEDLSALTAALNAAADPNYEYFTSSHLPSRSAEASWSDAALVVWHAALPAPESIQAKQLLDHLRSGRSLLFLPPEGPSEHPFLGIAWADWEQFETEEPGTVSWWRSDSGALANTRSGDALPVGELEISQRRRRDYASIPRTAFLSSALKIAMSLSFCVHCQTLIPTKCTAPPSF